MNTSKSLNLDEILINCSNKMREVSMDWLADGMTLQVKTDFQKIRAETAAAIVEAVEGLMPEELGGFVETEPELDGSQQTIFSDGWNGCRTEMLQAIKEWQDYGDSK